MLFMFGMVTILFLIIVGGCMIYLLMGIGQLVMGYKEKNPVKKRAGWITAMITIAILGLAAYGYLRIVLI